MDGPVNPDSGRLSLDGVPSRYVPGQRYVLSVTLLYPEMDRAGFQLSTRFLDGSSKGLQAGRLMSENNRVLVAADQTNAIQYVQHSGQGLDLAAPATASWRVVWQAPDRSDATVVFNAAVNGANYDDSEFGDAVFLLTRQVMGPRP